MFAPGAGLRLLKAFLLAVVFAVLLVQFAGAQEDLVVAKPLTFCDTLEPYGYWWYFWNCGA